MTILVLSKQNLDKGTSGHYTYNPDLVSKADYSKYWDGTYWVFLGVAEGNVHRNVLCSGYCTVSFQSLYYIIWWSYPSTTPRNSVILLSLHPAFLTHKNPQRRKIFHGMHPKIDWSIWTCVFVEISGPFM